MNKIETFSDCSPATVAPVENARVSIIINNYNYASFLQQAIESALSQTYNNTELIIVDDGSTDGSMKIIEQYSDRATIIRKENGGQASAFNVGIARARGELILLLDSDDYLFPNAVETCVRKFPEGYSRVFFRLRVTDEHDNHVDTPGISAPFIHFDGNAIAAAAERAEFPSVPTSGNMFDARKLKAILPIPEKDYRICADNFIFVRTAEAGNIRSIDRELGAYRAHGSNNFCSLASSLFMNKKRLETQLDNYYKSTDLIEKACQQSGRSNCEYTERLKMDFYPLLLLCAGYAHGLDTQYVSNVSRRTLSSSILNFLRSGNDPLEKRLLQSVYLASLVWLPKPGSMALLRLKDAQARRKSKLYAS